MSNFPDAEEIVDPSTTNPLSQHKEIILDSDAQDSQSSEENEATMNKENGADPMDFELSLFHSRLENLVNHCLKLIDFHMKRNSISIRNDVRNHLQ